MKNKKLVMIGYRPGKKKRMKERTVILIEKKSGLVENDQPFEITGKIKDDMYSNLLL
jgi:hypothetical protein